MSINGIPSDFSNAVNYVNGLIENPQQKNSVQLQRPIDPSICAKMVPSYVLEEKHFLLQSLRKRALEREVRKRPQNSKVERISKEFKKES